MTYLELIMWSYPFGLVGTPAYEVENTDIGSGSFVIL